MILTMSIETTNFNAPEITLMIDNAFEGDLGAMNNLIKVVYPDLKLIASGIRHKQMQISKTLNTTSLVNEAWLKLNKYGIKSESRKHFFCIVAKAMRQILIDAAKKKLNKKNHHFAVDIDEIQITSIDNASWLIKLDEIVKAIENSHPRIAQVFDMKYFLGLSNDDIAQKLNITKRTIRRDWLIAKQTIEKII